MKMKESSCVKGKVSITLLDKNKKVKAKRDIKNLVVNTGLEYITSRMLGNGPGVMSHMGVGDDPTPQLSGDATLGSQVGARKALQSSTQSGDNNEQIIYVAIFNPGESTGALTEAGIFNALTNGVMLCRTTFPVVNKQADDTIIINWTISLFNDEEES